MHIFLGTRTIRAAISPLDIHLWAGWVDCPVMPARRKALIPCTHQCWPAIGCEPASLHPLLSLHPLSGRLAQRQRHGSVGGIPHALRLNGRYDQEIHRLHLTSPSPPTDTSPCLRPIHSLPPSARRTSTLRAHASKPSSSYRKYPRLPACSRPTAHIHPLARASGRPARHWDPTQEIHTDPPPAHRPASHKLIQPHLSPPIPC
ncbi:hypothetical protein DFH27DRAFT_311761 [Peziza echinospora]|nr:hypothetical protein DFH27DRAFT_311761 [Peziza echinospora]